MRTALRVGAASLAIVLAMGGAAVGAGIQLRTRDQDRLRDGSCQVAAIQLREQDRTRLRDRACPTPERLRDRVRERTRGSA